jgi:hypothetical protein
MLNIDIPGSFYMRKNIFIFLNRHKISFHIICNLTPYVSFLVIWPFWVILLNLTLQIFAEKFKCLWCQNELLRAYGSRNIEVLRFNRLLPVVRVDTKPRPSLGPKPPWLPPKIFCFSYLVLPQSLPNRTLVANVSKVKSRHMSICVGCN